MSPALIRLSRATLLSFALASPALAQSAPPMIDQSSPVHVADITGTLTQMGFKVSPIDMNAPWAFLAEYKSTKMIVRPEGCTQGKGCRFITLETRYNYPTAFEAADMEDFNQRSYCCKMIQPAPGKVHMTMTLPFGKAMTVEYFVESVATVYAMHGNAFKMLTEWHERGPRTAAAAPAPAAPADAPKAPGLGIGKADIDASAPKNPPSLGVGVGSFSLEELMR
ncbi:hypothetical protein FHY55_09580 [Oceanicola sp. D3]|uniref:hypothetical protein n=1 Tax=Oceanicola sp. D3 TaxID=2587163 RepID=UPI001121AE7B|nr:hypothetical protein [Oceanicola sp. D3]QDC09481.1 hypothetical protein FHY55_09580 [Oceanicola sp. D3]